MPPSALTAIMCGPGETRNGRIGAGRNLRHQLPIQIQAVRCRIASEPVRPKKKNASWRAARGSLRKKTHLLARLAAHQDY
jgi:hypothetical protein